MTCQRTPLQFNNFVFRRVISATFSSQKKVSSHDYSFNHGSFSFGNFQNSMDIQIVIGDDFCERYKDADDRRMYLSWMKRELNETKSRLYIQDFDGQILWADSYMKSFDYNNSFDSAEVQFTLTFTNPSGVWRKANKFNTFFTKRICDMQYFACHQCATSCEETENVQACSVCTCECPNLLANEALCSVSSFDFCDSGRLVASCIAGFENFGEKSYGVEIPLVAGEYCTTAMWCSGTDISSASGNIRLTGNWVNPFLNINGREMTIQGGYDGTVNIDLSTNKVDTQTTSGYYDISANRRCYKLPYFYAENGNNNFIRICGYQSAAKIFLNFDELTI